MPGEWWFHQGFSPSAEALQLNRVPGFAVYRGMMGSFFLFYAGANPANRCNLLQL